MRRAEIQEELEKPSDPSRRPQPLEIVTTGSAARKIPATRDQLTLDILIIGCLGAVYFIAAKLGLQLAFVYPSASSVWPGTGIALAAMLLLGSKVWPGIFIGAFMANLTTAGSTATSLGIAVENYRKFIDTLEGEINRARRTERRFAIIFIDVDDLKSINDKLGHIAGNQALCRVANGLRESCRAIDTMARFGGDEFAVILPEADEDAARGVAQRVADRLMTKQD